SVRGSTGRGRGGAACGLRRWLWLASALQPLRSSLKAAYWVGIQPQPTLGHQKRVESWRGWQSLAAPRQSGIFRSVDEPEALNLGCIQPVHDFKTDDTSCCIAFALGNQRRCRRIKGSAMRTEEGRAFEDRSYERHVHLPYSNELNGETSGESNLVSNF